MLRIALIEPDIPQNTGSIARLASCMNIELHIVEPVGFIWSDRKFKRSSMDYWQYVKLVKHDSWQDFLLFCETQHHRTILATTKAQKPIHDIIFTDNDMIIFGSESKGVNDSIHEKVDIKAKISMIEPCRSLNLAMSVALVCGLVYQQQHWWP